MASYAIGANQLIDTILQAGGVEFPARRWNARPIRKTRGRGSGGGNDGPRQGRIEQAARTKRRTKPISLAGRRGSATVAVSASPFGRVRELGEITPPRLGNARRIPQIFL